MHGTVFLRKGNFIHQISEFNHSFKNSYLTTIGNQCLLVVHFFRLHGYSHLCRLLIRIINFGIKVFLVKRKIL